LSPELAADIHRVKGVRKLISWGSVNECGSRDKGTDGIADFDFGYTSFQEVGGIGQVCLVAFALGGEEVGEVGVVEEFRSRAGIFFIANARRGRWVDFLKMFETRSLNLEAV
jgi:hypothetical protein